MQKIIIPLLIIFLSSSCFGQTKQETTEVTTLADNYNFPEPIGYVNDYASILDSLEVQILEDKLKVYKNQTSNEIVIVTINLDELTEENFEEYALGLSRFWGIGTREKNNGLTIVLSPTLRKMRISTGLGTEKILTDEICKNVIDDLIIPEFKKDNYFNGLDKGIDELIRLWK